MAVEVGYSLVVLGATWRTLEFRVYPYNRDVAIIFLPTECAASFCSQVSCIWLSGGYIRQRCVVDSNSLNPSIEWLVRLDVKVVICCAPVCLKMKWILSLPFGPMTIPTSFCGRYVLALKCKFLSIIWFFPSFYLWLLWLNASKYLTQCWNMSCFTLISTFNLTPSATGTTGRDGRKTPRFYQLVQLVISCPSLLVLKYKEISHFVFWSVYFGNCYDWL